METSVPRGEEKRGKRFVAKNLIRSQKYFRLQVLTMAKTPPLLQLRLVSTRMKTTAAAASSNGWQQQQQQQQRQQQQQQFMIPHSAVSSIN
jgi:hypothetical protein